MFKINQKLMPIKAHFFFFMAAMGPILPQISVYGKQLGISPDVMGLITSVLPILYIIAKPSVGYLADYFSNLRKCIFMSVIIIMTISYTGFYFVPSTDHQLPLQSDYNFTLNSNQITTCDINKITNDSMCHENRPVTCKYDCYNNSNIIVGNLAYNNSENLYLICSQSMFDIIENETCDLYCKPNEDKANSDCLYNTSTFYVFVILMCLGTIGFNVTNCISDAICFDMLGEFETMKYGAQRVWGTIGFGLSALIAGIAVDEFTDGAVKSIAPAIIIMVIFSCCDLLSITTLKLPQLSTTESIFNDVRNLLKNSSIVIFLVFATIAGVIDSFIIYYMFWHLEEVAASTGHMESIKLIEGCVVAAECLGGEILFFLISGKILKKIGYVHCLSLCFFTYSIRLTLISFISNPWYLVPVEFFMQGASYALCYTCIVAYASAISPAGTSATIQGLVAGMDDGLGFAIGSLIGGQMYKRLGGAISFRVFGVGAFVTCVAHILLRPSSKHDTPIAKKSDYQLPPEQLKN